MHPRPLHPPVPLLAGGRTTRRYGSLGASLARLLVLTACLTPLCIGLGATYVRSIMLPPKPQREFRAAWVASVGNIDWPSTNGLTTAQQKAELVAILNRALQLKLNTIILQVRPACDALYASPIEPWSEYLTGTMGKAPEPYYDPLAFAITEAHQRGLELHAWFNPYRARLKSTRSPASASHVSHAHPQWVRSYGKYLWLDPGEKEVQDYSLSVVMDVVRRYDIDGVHFDDYFYPYTEKDAAGRDMDFPDDITWKRFGARGKLSREDWRRENVNTFIQRVYRSIKAEKPWVRFGVSPFGIWRPGVPPGIDGYDAYAKLYADSRLWLANGWLDYFAPQLYWSISAPQQSFPALLKWWAQQNPQHRHLLAGMDSTKTRNVWPPVEILRQIAMTRKQHGTSGHCHWNMTSLMRNNVLAAALKNQTYAEPALLPASPWLRRTAPSKPAVSIQCSTASATAGWSAPPGQPAELWVLQTRRATKWTTEILPGKRLSSLFNAPLPDTIAISMIDRFGNASPPAVFALRP